MTTETDTKTSEQIEREAAEAAFAAASDETPVKAVQKEEKDEVRTEEAKPEAKEEPTPDPWAGVPEVVKKSHEATAGQLADIAKQFGTFHKVFNDHKADYGRIAAVLQRLEAAKTAPAVKDAPSQAQIDEAAKSPEKWTKLKEEFTEWADGVDERINQRIAAERAEIVKQIPKVDIKPEIDSFAKDLKRSFTEAMSASEARTREIARIDAKHPEWEETINTQEFTAWRLAQPQEVQALAASTKAKDAIKMLDAFVEHRAAEAERAKKQERLERAAPAKGTPGQRQPTQSEREAAEKAFAAA